MTEPYKALKLKGIRKGPGRVGIELERYSLAPTKVLQDRIASLREVLSEDILTRDGDVAATPGSSCLLNWNDMISGRREDIATLEGFLTLSTLKAEEEGP